MNADLACGSCSRRVSEMRGACLICGRDPDGVRHDVEHRVEPLLRLRAALLASTHIYASYELSFVEQELRGYGLSTSTTTRPFLQRPVRERRGADSAAVGDSAVSSTARRWVNSSGCRRPRRGCSAARIETRPLRSRFLPRFERLSSDGGEEDCWTWLRRESQAFAAVVGTPSCERWCQLCSVWPTDCPGDTLGPGSQRCRPERVHRSRAQDL